MSPLPYHTLEKTCYIQASLKKWGNTFSLPWLGQAQQQVAGPVGYRGHVAPQHGTVCLLQRGWAALALAEYM